MQSFKQKAVFLKLNEKSGTSKTTGKPYSFATLRAIVGDEVLEFPVDLQKVQITDLRQLKVQENCELELTLVASRSAGYGALEARVSVVGVDA